MKMPAREDVPQGSSIEMLRYPVTSRINTMVSCGREIVAVVGGIGIILGELNILSFQSFQPSKRPRGAAVWRLSGSS